MLAQLSFKAAYHIDIPLFSSERPLSSVLLRWREGTGYFLFSGRMTFHLSPYSEVLPEGAGFWNETYLGSISHSATPILVSSASSNFEVLVLGFLICEKEELWLTF